MNLATLTRRGAFAAPLALAPLPAMAGLPLHSQADPAIAAGREWRTSVLALRGAYDDKPDGRAPANDAAALAAYDAALRGMSETTAETFAGLSLQLRAALEGISDIEAEAPRDPVDWSRDDFCIPDCFEPAASLRIVWRAIETLDRWATAVGRVEA